MSATKEGSSASSSATATVLGRIEYLDPNEAFLTNPLEEDYVLTFGRDAKCDICLDCPHVAAVQTKVFVQDNKVWISDVGPSTAEPVLTSVNASKLGLNPLQLHPNDEFEIFGRRFRYVTDKEVLEPSSQAFVNVPQPMAAPAPAKSAQKTDIMDQLFERIKATKGEDYFDAVFEQWRNLPQSITGLAVPPLRKDYNWFISPELAHNEVFVYEHPHNGTLGVYLPLGSFVPKQQPKPKRVARRSNNTKNSSSREGAVGKSDEGKESDCSKAEVERIVNSDKEEKMKEEQEEKPAEDEEEDEAVRPQQKKPSSRKVVAVRNKRTAASTKGRKKDDAKKADETSEQEEVVEEEEEEEEKENKKASKALNRPTTKPVATYSRTARRTAKPARKDHDEGESALSDHKSAEDEEEADDLDIPSSKKAASTKSSSKKTKSLKKEKEKKQATKPTKHKPRRKRDEDDEDDDYDQDANDEEDELVNITGLDDEDEEGKDESGEAEKEEGEDEEEVKPPVVRKAKRSTAKPKSNPKPAPAADTSNNVRRSGRPARSGVLRMNAEQYRAAKAEGRLVDSFSPNKSLRKNFIMEFEKRKKQSKETPKGVRTRNQKADLETEQMADPVPADNTATPKRKPKRLVL